MTVTVTATVCVLSCLQLNYCNGMVIIQVRKEGMNDENRIIILGERNKIVVGSSSTGKEGTPSTLSLPLRNMFTFN